VPNRAALTIMTRNTRMPESLAGDLDAEASACTMGAARLGELFTRYGRATVEAAFDAIVENTAETFRREILARIPEGTWMWEDYAEHDGVDEPMLHRQRITLTKEPDRLILDFNGTGPQAKGPINHVGDAADGNFLKKWLGPILRNLAETPERMAELDVNEGIVELIEMRFPPKGTLLTPEFPAPTNARTFVILRLLGVFAGVLAKAVGGDMPADQETIRYTGVYGRRADGSSYLMREVLGGGSGGRPWGDGEDTIHVVPDSRNLPTEFTESRFPFRVERLSLAIDSGGPGTYRGGLGYEKHIRMLEDASFMSIADRSILSCWGVKGGLAGAPFRVTLDPGRPGGARPRRSGRRRAHPRGPGRAHPHDGRRRLGRPARARPGARRPRRTLVEGLARRCGARLRGRARRSRRGRDGRRHGDRGPADVARRSSGDRCGSSIAGPGYATLDPEGRAFPELDVVEVH
jgi:N-methylhydantoinase B